jgi:hypothetical protein
VSASGARTLFKQFFNSFTCVCMSAAIAKQFSKLVEGHAGLRSSLSRVQNGVRCKSVWAQRTVNLPGLSLTAATFLRERWGKLSSWVCRLYRADAAKRTYDCDGSASVRP